MTSMLTLPQMPDGSQAPEPSVLVSRAKALGWTQNEMAQQAGFDSGYISRLLNDKAYGPRPYIKLVRTVEREERRRAKKNGAAA